MSFSGTHLPDVTVSESASAIFRGTVRHRRFCPIEHAFTYRITMLMLDLDFLGEELNLPPLTSSTALSAGWFRRKDYAGSEKTELKDFIINRVETETGHRPDGKVLLLTHLRYWGFVMNPISVFYCYSQDGELSATVLQVTNTPWREKVLYVLDTKRSGKNIHLQFQKEMHVSPFNPMDMMYHCKLQRPGKSLFFHLENHQADQKVTDATMVFKRQTLTQWKLIKLVFTQPAMTVQVGIGIYWQALRLWIKRAPVFDHPAVNRTDKPVLKTRTTVRNTE